MDGFAQGLLAGFSTVDNAMQQRKALGLREAALAQEQKNADRNYQLAQDEFGYRKESDQKNLDLKKEQYAKEDDHWNKTFAVDSAYKNAQIGLESRRLRNAENQMDYMRRRQERDDMLKQDEPIAQWALNAYQKGDYKATWDFINQLHDGNPMKQMIKPGYAQSSMNAMNGISQILQGHPDDAIKSLNKPDMLKNLSVTFGSELSSRIGMKDPKTGKTITDAQIGAILPSPDGKGIVLGLDLTYDDGSKSHKPVTKYGSADPRDSDVLNIPGEQAMDYLMQRSSFANGLQKGLEPLGYMMSEQGLSLAEQQKIAGNSASGAARAGNDPGQAYNSMMATFGAPGYHEKVQQSQAADMAKQLLQDPEIAGDPSAVHAVNRFLQNGNIAMLTKDNVMKAASKNTVETKKQAQDARNNQTIQEMNRQRLPPIQP
ncbi:hypothetical protein AXA88_25705 [Salmonella enterica]|nr:hypothetical protein [Salmonella enterica]EAX3609242.1 hypothetical protein [Salmonella enterica]EGW6282775.1 hypothetical protein [Salmonella enterica]EGX3935180.1 hypothetical protein [Salmonella enterica]